MLDKQIFFAGYSDEELERAKPMFEGGGGGLLCLREVRTY